MRIRPHHREPAGGIGARERIALPVETSVERAQPLPILRGVERVVRGLIRQRGARLDRRQRDAEILRAIAERHDLEERRVERRVVSLAELRFRPQRHIGAARDGEGFAAGVGEDAVEVEDEELHARRRSVPRAANAASPPIHGAGSGTAA